MSLTDGYFELLLQKYLADYEREGIFAYQNISKYLLELEQIYKLSKKGSGDKAQGWKAIKGRLFEKIIQYIIKSELPNSSIEFINDFEVRKLKPKDKLYKIKEQIQIVYGEHEPLIPDADIIVYNSNNLNVLAIISCKITLRERIAQSAYWSLKLNQKSSEPKN